MGEIARRIALFYGVSLGVGLVLLVIAILARSAYDALLDRWNREEVSRPSESEVNRVTSASERREA
jgi:hypothetical protein